MHNYKKSGGINHAVFTRYNVNFNLVNHLKVYGFTSPFHEPQAHTFVNKHECYEVMKLRTFLPIKRQGQTALIMLYAMPITRMA